MSGGHLALGIPVYNQASTIEETICSVLSQTEPFDEIVICENHSTDGTAEVLQTFADRVRIIRPPRHLSMAENWNYCVANMTSDWFSLLSGDDLLKQGFSSAVKKVINIHSNAALVRTDWDVIDDKGSITRVHKQLGVSHITKPPETWLEQLNGPKVSFAAFAAKHEFWKDVGGYPENFHLFQDWMFWLKLAPLGEFIRVPAVLAQYRSQERPELEIQRAKQRLEDEYRYLMDVLPALPWSGSRVSSKIRAVYKKRLLDLLNYLISYPQLLEDEECRRKLNQLAELAGIAKVYQDWLLNRSFIEPTIFQSLVSKGKRILRKALNEYDKYAKSKS